MGHPGPAAKVLLPQERWGDEGKNKKIYAQMIY